MKSLKKQIKNAFFCLSLLSIAGGTIIGQADTSKVSWYKVKKLAEKTWRIDDNGSDNFYLIEGNKKALLIDNGLGVANLRDLAKSLTKLPITLVITHGHLDHDGAAYQFHSVYAHPLDFKAIESDNSYAKRIGMLQGLLSSKKLAENEVFKDTLNLKPLELKPVKDAFVFDLGGRKIEVIEVPGHTPGSVVLLDVTNKMLFSGDNDNTIVWLFLRNCTPLEIYLKSLEKLQKRSPEFTIIYPGHGEPLDPEFISEQIVCCKSILDGTCKGEKYSTFAGDALKCDYKRAGIGYNPDNLFIKK